MVVAKSVNRRALGPIHCKKCVFFSCSHSTIQWDHDFIMLTDTHKNIVNREGFVRQGGKRGGKEK